MSHSPLKMFRQFHDKHVLINGQGPVKEIALNLGFTNVTTVDELCSCFPYLDVMDHERCSVAVSGFLCFVPSPSVAVMILLISVMEIIPGACIAFLSAFFNVYQ